MDALYRRADDLYIDAVVIRAFRICTDTVDGCADRRIYNFYGGSLARRKYTGAARRILYIG